MCMISLIKLYMFKPGSVTVILFQDHSSQESLKNIKTCFPIWNASRLGLCSSAGLTSYLVKLHYTYLRSIQPDNDIDNNSHCSEGDLYV